MLTGRWTPILIHRRELEGVLRGALKMKIKGEDDSSLEVVNEAASTALIPKP